MFCNVQFQWRRFLLEIGGTFVAKMYFPKFTYVNAFTYIPFILRRTGDRQMQAARKAARVPAFVTVSAIAD